MIDSINKKFYSGQFDQYSLPPNHSLFTQYQENRYVPVEQVPKLICTSITLVCFFGNVHDRIMNSAHSSHRKLAEVVLLTLATVTVSPTFAVAETIIRLVPSFFALFAFFTDKSSKDSERMTIAEQILLGTAFSAISIATSIKLGYNMVCVDRLSPIQEIFSDLLEKLPG